MQWVLDYIGKSELSLVLFLGKNDSWMTKKTSLETRTFNEFIIAHTLNVYEKRKKKCEQRRKR